MKYTKEETFKPTKEDWHPNYNNLVRVVLMTNLKDENGECCHRVCVWGADDFGMEKDFLKDEKKEAIKIFKKLKEVNSIERQTLKGLGFVVA